MAKVLVLGAGFAGVNVCMNLIGSEHDVELLDINGSHEFKPGLVDLYRGRHNEDELRVNLNKLFEDTGIKFSREAVEDIDPAEQKVRTNAGTHDYTYLVVALGSDPATYGMDVSSADGFYSLTSAKKSVKKVEEAEKVTVVGAGYVGVEVAGEISEMGKEVSVVDSATRPMSTGNEESSHKIIDYMNNEGINFKGGSAVKRVEESKVVLENGKSIEHDACIWAAGVQASEMVQESLEVERRGVPVDKYLRWRKYPQVFALGDCADLDVIDTAHNAIDQAETVAKNIDSAREEMIEYEGSEFPLLVSLGDSGLMMYKETALRSSVFRKLKDVVMKVYLLNLRKKKLAGRIGL
ncbi:NAD(P)/FAD-dependent oxidoreductase [Candidatus Nanohalococcus occultus]|uniref:NAD(P)/FAD-dependent oxidoreductase n=1 Tax=Candidatus Nanohalococcus occultus TaxID=2978047 RepID=UPI0039E00A2B